MQTIFQLVLATTLLLIPASFFALPVPQSPPNINVSANLSPDKVKKGHKVQARVMMEIPSGFHVNAHRPLEKFLIATQLEIEVPTGLKVGPILYPRPFLRLLKFSKNKVAVYEGRTTIRFSVTVPRSFSANSVELKGRLKYQSCNDDVCFPPRTRDVSVWLKAE
jgi:DsbC/DsbD-like thiol-disulfide interchange protein